MEEKAPFLPEALLQRQGDFAGSHIVIQRLYSMPTIRLLTNHQYY